jgi:YfiR/HmsC-like
LKAAYIYNFAKFTEWSADIPAADPLVMCVLGDAAVGEALERAVVGRVIVGHRIVTSMVAATASKRACHVLYVAGVTAAQAGELVADLRDLPVLTISDIEGFTKVGGIAQLLFEHGQLRFRIDLASTKRARIQISSRLLIMARPND